jgi:hypothetical protein
MRGFALRKEPFCRPSEDEHPPRHGSGRPSISPTAYFRTSGGTHHEQKGAPNGELSNPTGTSLDALSAKVARSDAVGPGLFSKWPFGEGPGPSMTISGRLRNETTAGQLD